MNRSGFGWDVYCNLRWHQVRRCATRLPSSGQSDIQSSLLSWKDPGYTSGRYELIGHTGNQVDSSYSSRICGSESKVGTRREREGASSQRRKTWLENWMKSEDHQERFYIKSAIWARETLKKRPSPRSLSSNIPMLIISQHNLTDLHLEHKLFKKKKKHTLRTPSPCLQNLP